MRVSSLMGLGFAEPLMNCAIVEPVDTQNGAEVVIPMLRTRVSDLDASPRRKVASAVVRTTSGGTGTGKR